MTYEEFLRELSSGYRYVPLPADQRLEVYSPERMSLLDVNTPSYENLGQNPNNLPMMNQIYQGAVSPNQIQGNVTPFTIQGGGGTMSSGDMKGFAGGGRIGYETPINENQLLNIGVTGGGADVRYGMGTPYEGKDNQFKMQAIDAVLKDLAKNQEFGASVGRGVNQDPFYSLFYRKAF
jgi:hypothetical protein